MMVKVLGVVTWDFFLKFKNMYPMIINDKTANELIDERRRLAKKYTTLDNMLKHMDIEDIEAVLRRQTEVEQDLTEIQEILAILN